MNVIEQAAAVIRAKQDRWPDVPASEIAATLADAGLLISDADQAILRALRRAYADGGGIDTRTRFGSAVRDWVEAQRRKSIPVTIGYAPSPREPSHPDPAIEAEFGYDPFRGGAA